MISSWVRVSTIASRTALVGLLVGYLAGSTPPAHATDAPAADLRGLGCGGCHQLDEPPAESRTLKSYRERKGPDLFYAGSKFRPEWLREWLLHPTVIRPAGLDPARRTTTSAGASDAVVERPFAHPSVPEDQIEPVVRALVALDALQESLAGEAAKPVKVPRMLAELNFAKFKGCGSCHRTDDESPPLSGPDLHRAYDRLRPEFLSSYIAHPQDWDPAAPMPGYGLAPNEVGKLIGYLRILSEEDDDAKR